MEVILVRHAKAFERDAVAWPDDSRRPLTEQGRERFRRVARHLGRTMPAPEVVESSRFVRAWQTALVLHETAEWPKPVRFEALEAEGDEGLVGLRRSLAAMQGIERVAWVGHEPQLGRLASFLLADDPDAVTIDFRKGAVVALRLSEDVSGRARLVWMLTTGLAGRARRRG